MAMADGVVACVACAGVSLLSSASSAFRSGAATACGGARALTATRPQTGSPSARSKSLVVRAKMPQPGWYGGAPTDLKIRKTWGGQPQEDPLESEGSPLWDHNSSDKREWKRVLDLLDQELAEASATSSSSSAAAAAPARDGSRESQGPGFLSLGRSLALDSMDVDLTTELSKASAAAATAQAAAIENSNSAQGSAGSGTRWRAMNTPSSRQMQRLEKSKAKSWQGGFSGEKAPASKEEQERKFQELKASLLLYTLGLGVTFSATAALAYSPEVAASVALGSVGSLVYARMLSTSVEGIGSTSLGAAARGSLGQPRLLVPAVLVMAYNRWNNIVVPEYGFFELQLIPMLLGFFTYKAATFVRTFQDIVVEDAKPIGDVGAGLKVKEDA